MKLLSRLLILAVVFFAGVYVGGQKLLQFGDPITIPSVSFDNIAPQDSVSVLIDFGDRAGKPIRSYTVPITASTSVFAVLERVAQQQRFSLSTKDYGSGLGMFVEGVEGVMNDPRGDSWWQYWVNNRYASIGASNYHLQPGDMVMWKLTKGQVE